MGKITETKNTQISQREVLKIIPKEECLNFVQQGDIFELRPKLQYIDKKQ